jgi:DNA-binding NtrC family response regulator
MEHVQGARLLIAVNDVDSRKRISSFFSLACRDLELLAASGGSEALQAIRELQPQVVFCDLDLPDKSALELMVEARKEFPGMQFVIMTGPEDHEESMKALRLGASDYLRAPLDCDELLITVQRGIERWRQHERLGQHQAGLTQKLEAVGTLAGGIAHDFNNLLNSILGYAHLVLEDIPAEGLAHDNLCEVIKAGRRARSLVRKILAFSQQPEGEKIPVNAERAVREVLKLIESSLPPTISLHTEYKAGDALIMITPAYLQQVLINLCTNARQAMGVNGGVLTIRMQVLDAKDVLHRTLPSSKEQECLQISVGDTGTGMTPEVQEKIFDPFFSTRNADYGTGMGLSVVFGVVNEAGGSISVDSMVGRGTTVHLYFPLLSDAEPALPLEPMSIEENDGDFAARGERILFIDDREEIVELERRILSRLGYSVSAFTDGLIALEAFKANPGAFDLVITDQMMPGILGTDLTRELHKLRDDIPVIICTGFSQKLSPDNAREAGASEFLEKPVEVRELAGAIRRALGRRSPAQAHSGKRLLIIDDDQPQRAMLRQLLERAGYEIFEAPDGNKGIQLLKEVGADLIITDIFMPDTDGLEVIREIRRQFPDIKIISISGGSSHVAMDFLRISRQLGAVRAFAKPIDYRQLVNALSEEFALIPGFS